MKTLQSTLLITVLTLASVTAHAGIWDSISSFFGDSSASETTQAAAEEPASQNLLATGIKLIPLITKTLGVTDGQATGGMGALLQAVKLLMPNSDFASIVSAIPNASSLMDAAPAPNNGGGLLDTAMKFAGEQNDTVKVGLDLVSKFKSLGLSADMIPKFSDVAEGYLSDNNSADTGKLLSSALANIL